MIDRTEGERNAPEWGPTRGALVRFLGLLALLLTAAALAWSIGPRGGGGAGGLVEQGELALAANRVGAALLAANEALAQAPGDARAAALKERILGRLRAQGPQPVDAAVAARERTLSAARGQLEAGQGTQAVAALKELLARGPDAGSSGLLARALLQAGDATAAAAALADAGDAGADDPTRPEPAPLAGSDSCARCHAAIVRDQHASRHARTLRAGAEVATVHFPEAPVPDPSLPGVTHAYRRDGDVMRLDVTSGGATYQALLAYAVGSGDRGVSFIGLDENGQARLCRMSLFDHDREPHVTPQAPGEIREPGEHVGLRMTDSLVDCLGCHSTRLASGGPGAPARPVDRGISCERCHGPAGLHELAVAAKLDDLLIARPKLASAAQITELCGQCHRPPRGQTLADDDPSLARQQALRLPQSRCYTGSGGRMSCVTCHNPHRDASTDTATYVTTCLGCHTAPPAGSPAPDPVATGHGAPCPVNPTADCITCHMPRVPNPAEHTEFTDHYIRADRDR